MSTTTPTDKPRTDSDTCSLVVSRHEAEQILQGLKLVVNHTRYSHLEPGEDPLERTAVARATLEKVANQVRSVFAALKWGD